jgi:hypothetical protein
VSESYRYEHYDPGPSKVADVSGVPLDDLAAPLAVKFNSAL